MKRRTAVLLGVVVVVAADGVYAWRRLATGGKVTEVSVTEALDRYREQIGATTTGPTASTVPPTTEVHAVTTTTVPPTTEVHAVTTTTARSCTRWWHPVCTSTPRTGSIASTR